VAGIIAMILIFICPLPSSPSIGVQKFLRPSVN
jgi:hypothetical protein